MVVTLYAQEILNDLRSKSHYEVSAIPGAEAQYRVEAGTEKMDEVVRCINEGVRRLYGRLRRWLRQDIDQTTDNTSSLPDEWTFELAISERRAIATAQPLSEVAHTFVVEYALSKFYSDMAVQDYSNKHSTLALDAAARLDELLYTKMPPLV